MNMPALTPETMTAEQRRETWFHRELAGYFSADNIDYRQNWDYGPELLELLASRFRVIEMQQHSFMLLWLVLLYFVAVSLQ
jgi:hypothetical protein